MVLVPGQLLRTDPAEERGGLMATAAEGLVRGEKPPPQQGTCWDVLWRSKQFLPLLARPRPPSAAARASLPCPHGTCSHPWGLAFLPAWPQRSGFGPSAVEVKHGCIWKHLCPLPHYFLTSTHKYPFHAQLMKDLLGWVTTLAAALQLALYQDLASEYAVGL